MRMMSVRQRFSSRIGAGPYQWHWVPHHEAHALSAFLPSPFEEAAVLVIDGSGELASTSWYRGQGTQCEALGSVPFPHSLGYYYSSLTQYLGFRPAVAEGKTMGLASYGSVHPDKLAVFRQMIQLDSTVDLSWFRYQEGGERYYSDAWEDALGPARMPEGPLTQQHYDVAAAGQARLEEVLLDRLRKLYTLVPSPNLCLAGGVALNCVANGKIVEETPFERLFVQPVAHDAGTAYGAALAVHGQRVGPQVSVAWGPRYEGETIDAAIQAAGLAVVVEEQPVQTVAKLLDEGQVVGWFRGRCELGPRALGHRSILADPRRPEMPDRVNAKVKRRESFRPFAPVVMAEHASNWFSGEPGPFMTTVHRVLRPEVPAITHVDGTARVQTVSATDQPDFHALLAAFYKRTQVPVLLNTSFNLRGEPIVCHPREAIEDFLKTEMDALLLEDRLLRKGSVL